MDDNLYDEDFVKQLDGLPAPPEEGQRSSGCVRSDVFPGYVQGLDADGPSFQDRQKLTQEQYERIGGDHRRLRLG